MTRQRWRRAGNNWDLTVWAGPARVAVGWWYDSTPSEWTFEVFLGPVSISLWRQR